MHRLPSSKSVARMRMAAMLVCLKCLMAPLAGIVFLWAFIKNNDIAMITGLMMMFAALFLVIAEWLVAARANCPLCITPVMVSKGCARHRKARPFLGSHRLRVALSVVFTGAFRCPYCGEPTVLVVRERGGR